MTTAQKLGTLLAIVECAPAARAMTVFESAVRRRDLSAFWDHYQDVLGSRVESCRRLSRTEKSPSR